MIKLEEPEAVYDTIRNAFYNIALLQILRNVLDNMPNGEQYREALFDTFKQEMHRQALRNYKIALEEAEEAGVEFGEDSKGEAINKHTLRIDSMVDEIVGEFRSILTAGK